MEAKDLTKGDIARHLFQIALPIMGTSFVQMAYSFTDMAWLGRLGSDSVAAVGIVSVFMWIATSLTYLTKTGSEVNVAQALGVKQYVKAQIYASHNTTIGLLLGVLIMLIYAVWGDSLIGLYHCSLSVYNLSSEYMYIALLGLPAIFLSYTLFGIYNATGNSYIPFVILSLGLASNIILDPLLIHVLSLGVSGAAWATVISQYLVLLCFFVRLKYYDKLLNNFTLFCIPRSRVTWDIMKIGLPAATLNVLFALITVYMGRLVSEVGGDIGVAVLTTGGQLEALTWNTAQGVTTALSTLVAQNYSAQQFRRVWEAYRKTLVFTLVVGFGGTLYFAIGGESLFKLIVPDSLTAAMGGVYLKISSYSQMLMMVEITTQGLLYGIGRSYIPATISISGNILRIPLASVFLFYGLGIEAVWWAISLSAALKGVLSIIVVFYLYRNKVL